MASTSITTIDVFQGTGKRERILRAAVEVFARTGYFNAKVTDVASGAGVADGTIYLYFQGKEDLLLTIFEELTASYLERLADAIAGCRDAEAQVREAIRFHLETLGDDRSLAVVFQVELRQSLKFMSLLSRKGLAEYLTTLRQIIERGQSQGLFRADLQPQLTANLIFGILDEMVTSWILSEKEYDLTEHAQRICDFVLRGLR
ncbi:MAG: TetR/AcrR family transcriptional regulator [Acidobacteriota bacterium]